MSHRVGLVGYLLLCIACVLLAYYWIYTLEPSDPLIPFGLMFLAGGCIREAVIHFDALAE